MKHPLFPEKRDPAIMHGACNRAKSNDVDGPIHMRSRANMCTGAIDAGFEERRQKIERGGVKQVGLLASLLAAAATVAVPAAAQSGGERVGDWSVAKIAVSEGGNVCSALRLYGDGYGLEITQARGLPGKLIMRLESPMITYRPGQTGENISDPYGLIIVIGGIAGGEGPDAIVRQGPRGLGFVTVLEESGNPKTSPIHNLRAGQSVYAYIGAIDEEVGTIGYYSLAGSGAALDALARCVNGDAIASPPVRAPAKPAAPAPMAGSLPVPFGRYTANGDCAQAHMLLTPQYWGDDADGEGWAIGPFRDLGGNRWALSGAVTINVTGSRSFAFKGRTMTWCGA